MKPIISLCLSVICSSVAFGESGESFQGSQTANKPNVIFILADDLGYGDIGCNGQTKILTPQIDDLAKNGIRLTSHYSGQAVCSPSRASLMLGQHMGHCRITNNGNAQLIDGDFILPMLFKRAGYTTGMIGKWGLMGARWDDRKFEGPTYPNNVGFDYWYGFESQGYAHFYYPLRMLENKKMIEYPENNGIRNNGYYAPGKGSYVQDLFEKKTLSFIRTHKDNPFFLYLPYPAPHAELVVPSDCPHLDYYNRLGWDDPGRKEGGGGGAYGSPYKKGYCASKHPNATYAAMVSRMDDTVGKVVNLLQELKIDQNTLIIFTSDNGPSAEGGQSMEFFKSRGNLRGYKRSIYEGGTRVPFVAMWPARIPQGIVSGHLCGLNDFMASICDLTGQPLPESTDGLSYLPTLLNQPKRQIPTPYRYSRWRDRQAIRVGDWKLIATTGNKAPQKTKPLELYNLSNDPAEKNNRIHEFPEKVEQLLKTIQAATRPL